MLLVAAETIAERFKSKMPHSRTLAASAKAEIAELRDEQIADLPNNQLILAIRAAQLPYLNQRFEHRLEFCSRDILVRLVHLARHCCRNQGH